MNEELINSGDCSDDRAHDDKNNITESLLRNTNQSNIDTNRNSRLE